VNDVGRLATWFRNLPIRRKASLGVLATSGIALVLIAIIVAVSEYRNARRNAVQQVAVLTEVIAANTRAALAFDDARAATETLATLGVSKVISHACLYDEERRLFAVFQGTAPAGRGPSCAGQADGAAGTAPSVLDHGPMVSIHAPVRLNEATLGELRVHADIPALRLDLANLWTLLILIVLISVLSSLLLATALQRLIVVPIRALVGVMSRVAEGGDRSSRMVRTTADEVGGLIAAFNTMLDQLEAQARALKQNQELLESKVQERTRDLELANDRLLMAIDQLKAAKESAEMASRTKSNFLANVSHELRTPLNAIIGFSEMMELGLMGPLNNPRYQGYASDIRKSGSHLLELINNLLDLSKIEAGRMEINDTAIDAARLMEEVSTLIAPRAAAGNLAVTLRIAPAVEILVDDLKFKQILVNLASNAVKFTPAGGTVTLAIEPEADGGVTFVVADTGVGIAPADLPRALEPFGQIDSLLSRRHVGTGLGLPLAKSLAELHGCRFEIESVVGQGTTVRVGLPPRRVVGRRPRLVARQQL